MGISKSFMLKNCYAIFKKKRKKKALVLHIYCLPPLVVTTLEQTDVIF